MPFCRLMTHVILLFTYLFILLLKDIWAASYLDRP